MIQDSGFKIQETEKFAVGLATSIDRNRRIFALVGDLGAGKTTFSRFFLQALGVVESVTSPTFVIMKNYPLTHSQFTRVYHIDCYRLKNTEELAPLGFAAILADEKNIVLVEWADRIRDALPSQAVWIDFAHVAETERRISLRL